MSDCDCDSCRQSTMYEIADRSSRQTTCYFCEGGWGSCTCLFNGIPMSWGGVTIGMPNQDRNRRRFVDPHEYYGDAFAAWVSVPGNYPGQITRRAKKRPLDELRDKLVKPEVPTSVNLGTAGLHAGDTATYQLLYSSLLSRLRERRT